MHTTNSLPQINRCWNAIGVTGDRTCPQLPEMIHCRNCPVYTTAGRSLLEREAPVGYLSSWTDLLAQENSYEQTGLQNKIQDTLSVLIFRLGREWFGLQASLFKEVTHIAPIHTIPHRSNQVLQGLVNIRGELHLCISLAKFLEVGNTSIDNNHGAYKRLVVVEKAADKWVFPVDQIDGIHRINHQTLENLPATVSKAKDNYTQAIISLPNQSVSYLDDELLFYTLNRRLL